MFLERRSKKHRVSWLAFPRSQEIVFSAKVIYAHRRVLINTHELPKQTIRYRQIRVSLLWKRCIHQAKVGYATNFRSVLHALNVLLLPSKSLQSKKSFQKSPCIFGGTDLQGKQYCIDRIKRHFLESGVSSKTKQNMQTTLIEFSMLW